MASAKGKIHLIYIKYGSRCVGTCDHFDVVPINVVVKKGPHLKKPLGTFDPTKVTCKRCLNHPDYKEVIDKVNNPLFYWKERI